MDIGMPLLSGLEATKQFAAMSQSPRVDPDHAQNDEYLAGAGRRRLGLRPEDAAGGVLAIRQVARGAILPPLMARPS
jgi:hypothetical protein